jgi:hypothetical protein
MTAQLHAAQERRATTQPTVDSAYSVR